MKTILLSMFICFILPVTQPERVQEPVNPKGDFLTEFEAGFKHVLDNVDALQNATIEEVVQDVLKASGQKGTVTILTINEMKDQANSQKSIIPMAGCFLDLLVDLGTATSYLELLYAITTYDQCLDGLGYGPKSPERQFVITYKATMDLLYNELQHYRKGDMASEDFIPHWLECAAGILGGMGSGFVSGGGVGYFYGGIEGALAGGIIGGIAGGLGGAADHC